jgi:hypothetical protein
MARRDPVKRDLRARGHARFHVRRFDSVGVAPRAGTEGRASARSCIAKLVGELDIVCWVDGSIA